MQLTELPHTELLTHVKQMLEAGAVQINCQKSGALITTLGAMTIIDTAASHGIMILAEPRT